VLVTPRRHGSPERLELDRRMSESDSKDRAGRVTVMEADAALLASQFEFV
jgi:hypothetical protein